MDLPSMKINSRNTTFHHIQLQSCDSYQRILPENQRKMSSLTQPLTPSGPRSMPGTSNVWQPIEAVS